MLKKFNFEEFKNLLLSDEKIICCSNYFEGITRNFFIVKIPVHKDLTFVYETSVSLGSEDLVFPHNFLIPNKELEYVGMVVKGELVNISFPSFLFHRNYTDRNESECFNNEREQTWEKKRIFREICIRKIADYCEKNMVDSIVHDSMIEREAEKVFFNNEIVPDFSFKECVKRFLSPDFDVPEAIFLNYMLGESEWETFVIQKIAEPSIESLSRYLTVQKKVIDMAKGFAESSKGEKMTELKEIVWSVNRNIKKIKTVQVDLTFSDETTSENLSVQVEALYFARIDSMQSPSIPLYGVIKKQDRERIKQILENESKYYFDIPISAVQKISYRKNVLWERK